MRDVERLAFDAAEAHVYMAKAGGAPSTTHSLGGRLYLSSSGWLLLDVPNAFVRGAFQALHEPGAQLPPQSKGGLNAHITVMKPDEVNGIGAAKITERGKTFHYTLGPLKEVEPEGWPEMSKCWFVEISSPELKALRKSYGLTPLPADNRHPFHITVGVRKRHVLRDNEVSKAAGDRSRVREVLQDAVNAEKDLLGVDVYLHDAAPKIVIVDIMDYGSEEVGKRIGGKAARCVGGEHVIYHNEQPKPRGGAWVEIKPAGKKEAGILWPALQAGNMALDIAGLKALAGGGAPPPVDPAEQVDMDTSHLDLLRGKKRRRPKPVTQQPAPVEPAVPPAPVLPLPEYPVVKLADYYRRRGRSAVHDPRTD